MEKTTITISKQYNGPPASANGGYVSGLIAASMAGAASVSLKSPPPLDVALTLLSDGQSAKLINGDTLIAEGHQTDLDLRVPSLKHGFKTTPIAALETGEFEPFDSCFVCGNNRQVDDGLHIISKSVENRSDLVAGQWELDENISTDGFVKPEFIWAALDCPGYFACAPGEAALLGKFDAEILRPLPLAEQATVIGWDMTPKTKNGHALSGRKRLAGTAVLNAKGDVIAKALAVWVKVTRDVIMKMGMQ